MRNLRVRFFAGAASVFLALALSRPATADMTYAITDLGALVGGTSTVAFAINNNGQVIGWGDTASMDFMGNPASNAFVFKSASLINLGTLGGDNSYAYGINGAGKVVGSSHTGAYDVYNNPIFHAFAYTGGPLLDLGTLGGVNSYAEAVNAFGVIAGQADTASQDSIAFIGNASGLHTIPGLGNLGSEAYAINSHGQVVGWANTSSYDPQAFLSSGNTVSNLGAFPGERQSTAFSIADNGFIVGGADTQNISDPTNPFFHACLFQNGSLTDIGTLGGNRSSAYGVNVFQQVVGFADQLASGDPRAFIWQNGVMKDLNTMIPATSAIHLQQANGINNSGQIVGYGSVSSGDTHAFLLTPFLMLQPAYVPSGTTSVAKITLDSPAPPPTGALVTITSDSPALAMPSTPVVSIGVGGRTATFNITTAVVTSDTTVHITATYNGVTRTAPLLIRAPATLSGVVNLEACAKMGGEVITLKFRDTDDSGSFTKTVTLASDGSFSLPNVPAGTYYLAVKGRIWLQKVVPLDAPDNGAPTISVNLLTGDANNDNSVDSTDFGILIGAFNTDNSTPHSGYDIEADFNCDGSVDSTDFGLLIGNFNIRGDL